MWTEMSLAGAWKQLRWISDCGQGLEDCSRRTGPAAFSRPFSRKELQLSVQIFRVSVKDNGGMKRKRQVQKCGQFLFTNFRMTILLSCSGCDAVAGIWLLFPQSVSGMFNSCVGESRKFPTVGFFSHFHPLLAISSSKSCMGKLCLRSRRLKTYYFLLM